MVLAPSRPTTLPPPERGGERRETLTHDGGGGVRGIGRLPLVEERQNQDNGRRNINSTDHPASQRSFYKNVLMAATQRLTVLSIYYFQGQTLVRNEGLY